MTVIQATHPQTIRKMFGDIAGRYDRANTVLSLGIHHLWRKRLVKLSEVQPGARILDCATGTGDLAFEFERKLKGHGKVVGTDFCDPMLKVARDKSQRRGSQVKFELADATALPYTDASFDAASIAFGIRNTQDPARTLAEMARVVRPGGRVLVLEFGQPKVKFVRALFGMYSKSILPRIGGWVSGKPEAYRYLQSSSAAFPEGERFLEIARSTGRYSKMRFETLQGGVAYLYILEVTGH